MMVAAASVVIAGAIIGALAILGNHTVNVTVYGRTWDCSAVLATPSMTAPGIQPGTLQQLCREANSG